MYLLHFVVAGSQLIEVFCASHQLIFFKFAGWFSAKRVLHAELRYRPRFTFNVLLRMVFHLHQRTLKPSSTKSTLFLSCIHSPIYTLTKQAQGNSTRMQVIRGQYLPISMNPYRCGRCYPRRVLVPFRLVCPTGSQQFTPRADHDLDHLIPHLPL